jgi:hypothetical protein
MDSDLRSKVSSEIDGVRNLLSKAQTELAVDNPTAAAPWVESPIEELDGIHDELRMQAVGQQAGARGGGICWSYAPRVTLSSTHRPRDTLERHVPD